MFKKKTSSGQIYFTAFCDFISSERSLLIFFISIKQKYGEADFQKSINMSCFRSSTSPAQVWTQNLPWESVAHSALAPTLPSFCFCFKLDKCKCVWVCVCVFKKSFRFHMQDRVLCFFLSSLLSSTVLIVFSLKHGLQHTFLCITFNVVFY